MGMPASRAIGRASRRVRAWQRGLRCMGNLLCMGLFESTRPRPPVPGQVPPPPLSWASNSGSKSVNRPSEDRLGRSGTP
jgi:hypothetical protein